MKIFTKASAFILTFLLIGCTGGNDLGTDQTVIFKELGEVRKANRAARKNPTPKFELTRAILDDGNLQFLKVTSEKRDGTAYMQPAAYRTGYGIGRVAVWKTGTGQSIVLRNDVLIGTKGFGNDLASADSTNAIKAVGNRSARSGQKAMYVRNDVNGTDPYYLQCSASVLESKQLNIFEKRFLTLHIREVCSIVGTQVSNDFWVDQQGTIRQSRQWAGPGLGYLEILLVE